MNELIDVFIVGGGPAGLSAAMTLGRGGRHVMVSDNGHPRNAAAAHMQNFPSRDGTPPAEFRHQIRSDLKKYENVIVVDIGVENITRKDNLFEVTLMNQQKITARKIILAHGVRDILPEIPGVKDIFGKSLFFCPYCHGYEHRNSPIALVANGEVGMHLAVTLTGLTRDLKIFTNGESEFTEEQMVTLKKQNIEVITESLSEFIHTEGQLEFIKLQNKTVSRSFVFIQAKFVLSSDIGVKLGCELNDMGLYKVDELGRTTQKGISVAGDVSSMRHSVLLACASAQLAASVLNHEILSEAFS